MPQAIPAIIAAAQSAYAATVGFVASGLTAVGVGSATATAIATSTVNLAISTTISVGINAVARSNIPSPELGRQNRKQAIPDRLSAYGRVRLGGAFMLWEVDREYALNVLALHDGLVDGFEQIYLNDDKVTISGGFVQVGPDLRYGKFSDLVRIDTRVGLPTETRYSQITDTSVWPSNARGDGIASLMMIAKAGGKEQFLRDYPNALPQPSAVVRAQLCYDPRLGARGTIDDDGDKLASATWQWTMNPVLQLLDYMTNPETGMGLDYTAKFLPRIDDWIESANVCEETVNGAPRYQCSASYFHSTAPADVIATFRATFDGWLSQDVNGVFTVQAGKYYAPTVTITDDHIVGMSRQFFVEDENAVNEVTISFTDPGSDYTEVETDPWLDEDDIAARGEIRASQLSLPWVPAADQARRLAKISVTKQTAQIRGTMLTTLDGLRVWSERRIRIQSPSDSDVMADIVVDVESVSLNPDMTVTISFIETVPAAYDWDTDDLPVGPVRPVNPAIPVPSPIGGGGFIVIDGGTPRLDIEIDDIGRDDLTYAIYYQVDGGSVVRVESKAVPYGGNLLISTGALPTQKIVDYYVTSVATSGAESDETAVFSDPTGGDPGGEGGGAAYAQSLISGSVSSSWQTIASATFIGRPASGWWDMSIIAIEGESSGAVTLDFRVIESGAGTPLATGSASLMGGGLTEPVSLSLSPGSPWEQTLGAGNITIQFQAMVDGIGSADISGRVGFSYTPGI